MRTPPFEIERFETGRAGGQGEGAAVGLGVGSATRGDSKLYGQAARGRWPMSEDTRAKVVEVLDHIVTNPELFGPRDVIAAARTLGAIDKINMEDEARTVPTPEVVVIEGRARADFSAMTDEQLDRFLRADGSP